MRMIKTNRSIASRFSAHQSRFSALRINMDYLLDFITKVNTYSCAYLELDDGTRKFVNPKPHIGRWIPMERIKVQKFWRGLNRDAFDKWEGYFCRQIETKGVESTEFLANVLASSQYWLFKVHGKFVAAPNWYPLKKAPQSLSLAVAGWLNSMLEIKNCFFNGWRKLEVECMGWGVEKTTKDYLEYHPETKPWLLIAPTELEDFPTQPIPD